MPPVPTKINGSVYPSQASAARALGCSASAVWLAIEEGREPGGKRGRRAVKCYVNGRIYPSVTDAAKDLGVTKAAISKRRARQRASE